MIKFLPDMLISMIKPKILYNIKEHIEDIIVAGINIKPIDFNKEKDLDKYLEGVKGVITEEITGVYIEGQEKLDINILKYIEDNINVKVFYGQDIKIKFLPFVLNRFYRILNLKLEENELLIIDDDIDRIKRTIITLSKYLAYITVIGLEEEDKSKLYDYILEETGISIFYPSNIERIVGNYDIIINFKSNMDYLLSRAKKQTLVFDFSYGNKEVINNRSPLIQDFYFKYRNIDGGNQFINSPISSSLFEALSLTEYNDDLFLYSHGRLYTIRNYVDNFIKFKGRF